MDDRHAVRVQVMTCARCELVKNCRHPVPYAGPSPARVACIGEAPGAVENEVGIPFYGPAGVLLRRELDMVGIDPVDVFFANVVSCYPQGTPNPAQVFSCSPNLVAQLRLARAEQVVVLGTTAWMAQDWAELAAALGFRYWRSPHPAAALRNPAYHVEMRSVLRALGSVLDAENVERVHEAFPGAVEVDAP